MLLLESNMPLPDFLTSDADNEIRLTGHRIRLIDVAQRYLEGSSVEGIVDHYPSLNLPLVHKVIAYFSGARGRRAGTDPM
jgi:hypothetical protein